MEAVWEFLRKPRNQKLLSWLGGGGVVIAGGIWAVVTYVWPAHETPNQCVDQGIAIGGSAFGSKITNKTTGGTTTTGPCVTTGKK
jgi:hypothetical protein